MASNNCQALAAHTKQPWQTMQVVGIYDKQPPDTPNVRSCSGLHLFFSNITFHRNRNDDNVTFLSVFRVDCHSRETKRYYEYKHMGPR